MTSDAVNEDAVGVSAEAMSQPAASRIPSTLAAGTWAVLIAVLALWVAARLGAFHLFGTVVASNGQHVRLPDTFATVDHPFHIARAETLLRALAAGHPLRWIGNHQGGYPVEFYPLGVAWLDVGLWGAFFGQLPMAAIHKLVIILIYLAPGLAYALMARRDRWPLGVALLAFAAHVAIPGGEYSGGYHELVDWGLVTNVAANVALLFVLVWLTSYLDTGSRPAAAGAAIAAAFAIASNPRTGIALAVVGVGAWLALALRPRQETDRATLRRLTGRLALVGSVAALLAAPEIVALLRFQHLYYFVRYSSYPALTAYLHASEQAVSWPVLLLGAGGLLAGLALPRRPVMRVAAVTLALYVAVTAVLSTHGGGLVEQLETPRLMPFQRLLTLYLAAVAVYGIIGWLTVGFGPRAAPLSDALTVGITALTVLIFVGPLGHVPADYRGLYPVQTSATTSLADYEEAVSAANAAAPPGTAILVLGSQLSWHEHFWAIVQNARPYFFDDWLWFWQTRQPGPYNSQIEHSYDPSGMTSTLSPAFLSEQGIGAVIVTDTARTSQLGSITAFAGAAPNLEPVQRGSFSVFKVRAPTDIVTLAGLNPTSLTVNDQSLQATGTSAGGTATIRRNWFPRWRATINGKPVPITETADGYMSVPLPAGHVKLTLTYAVDWLDWLARLALAGGIVAVAGLCAGGALARRGSGWRHFR